MASTTTFTAAAAANTTTSNTASGAASTKLAADMQSFLQLLTTQLKNQDPTQPLDPNQFTTQLAQFAGVEQQIASNQHLESLLGLQQASSMMAAAPLLGQQVEVESNTVGLLNGQSQTLRLPASSAASGSTSAVIRITAADGTVLREEVAPITSSATNWNWDGKDQRGNAVANGDYALSVIGMDIEGKSTGALSHTLTGTVTAINRVNGDPRLTLGGLSVSMSALHGLN